MRITQLSIICALTLFIFSPTIAQDGQNLGAGQTLKFTQDTPTGFGNATGGGQDSAGGSEIDQVWGDYDFNSGILSFSISGNLEGNFNKFFLFIDGVAGGENILDATNTDGGFNEIQNLAGLTFDAGFTADHGIRMEVGDGFYGIRGFRLTDDTSYDIATGGGFADLPLTAVGGVNGVTMGWDNSNILGVDGASAAGASTATTGFEFEIDLAAFLGSAPTQDIGLAGFITNGGGDFISNQVIGGLGGAGNLGSGAGVDFNSIAGDQHVTFFNPVPEPSSFAFLMLGGTAMLLRRRK